MLEENFHEDTYLLNQLYRRYVATYDRDKVLDTAKLDEQQEHILRKFKRKIKIKAIVSLIEDDYGVVKKIIKLNNKINNQYLSSLSENERYKDESYYDSITFLHNYVYDEEQDNQYLDKYNSDTFQRIDIHIQEISSHFDNKFKYIKKNIYLTRLENLYEHLENIVYDLSDRHASIPKNADYTSDFCYLLGQQYYDLYNIKYELKSVIPEYMPRLETDLMKTITKTLDSFFVDEQEAYKPNEDILQAKIISQAMIRNLKFRN